MANRIRHIQSTKRERARHLTANPSGLAGVLFLHFVDRLDIKKRPKMKNHRERHKILNNQ